MNIFKLLIWISFIGNTSYAQISINRNFNIELSENDSKAKAIEASLNAFLYEAKNGNYSNKYVDSTHLKKHRFFFNKLKGIGKNSKLSFNNPTILKSYTPDGNNYRVTIVFTGVRDSIPFIYQITEFKVVPYKNHYRFYSLFEDNTTNFKTKTFKNVTYHYNGIINKNKANEFAEFQNEFTKLTKVRKRSLDYYCFQSLDELLKSYGFLYSARQCNFLCYDLGFSENEGQFYITGTNNENYVFGYIGDFLYDNLPNKENIYWPFVNGLSTYYGGYGLSYDSMEKLKQQFRNKRGKNPSINFLEEFKKGRKSSINRHFSFYVMSAFLCEEIYKKKGFESVLKLVYSGAKGEYFFKNLKEELDIDEFNFHQTIIELIEEE